MAGLQGIGNQGIGQNGGLNGLNGLQGQQGGQDPLSMIKQVFEQLLAKLQQGDAQGCKGGNCGQQAQGAGEQGGKSLTDLIEELKRMAQQNPEAFKQAMQQNPAFAQVAQVALSGGGGAGAVGKM